MAANPPTPRTSSSAKPKSSDFVVKHAPEIKDRIVLVTGVSPGGLGAIFVERLSTCPTPPRRIILAGRSPAKFEEIKAKVEQNGIEAKVLALDLASFKSVRQAAEVVNGWDEGVDVLVNNAGIMAVPFTKTEDGYESQLQANHMGHFLFTGLIMDQLLKRENGRVVNVSSNGYQLGLVRYLDYNFLDGEAYDPWVAYGQSKSLQLLHAHELARRLGRKGLQIYAIHPAVFMSHLTRHGPDFAGSSKIAKLMGHAQFYGGFDFYDADESVASHFFASFDPDVKVHNGAYIELSKAIPEEDVQPWARGDIESKKAWQLSEKLVGQTFDF